MAKLRKLLTANQRKFLFSTYSSFRHRLIDPIIYRDFNASNGNLKYYANENPLTRYKVSLEGHDDKVVEKLFEFWRHWSQEEYVFLAESGKIDATTGWGILPRGRLEYYSLGLGRSLFIPKPKITKLLFSRPPQKAETTIISLRDTGEGNYFHFYNDVLSKILMLDKMGFDVLRANIIVANELYQKPYFQIFKDLHPLLRKLRWQVQDRQDIYHDTAVFCKPLTHRLDLINDLVFPIRQHFLRKGASRRFFVTRSKERYRHISNIEQINDVCKTLGFEVIDCDNMTLSDQINWFGNASHIVAIHGAGLANLFYASESAKLYEIFPPEYKKYLPFHYILLCRLKKIEYQCSIGRETQTESLSSFYVDPAQLEIRLRSFLAD